MLRLAALALVLILAAPATAQLALRADTVYTMAGAAIPDGVVLVKDGKIEADGPAASPAAATAPAFKNVRRSKTFLGESISDIYSVRVRRASLKR